MKRRISSSRTDDANMTPSIPTAIRASAAVSSLRRPITSPRGASSIEPAIIPASAALNTTPSVAGSMPHSRDSSGAANEIARMSIPSSMLRKKQNVTARNCSPVIGP